MPAAKPMTQHHILAPFHMVGGGIWHAIDLANRLTATSAEPTQLWSAKVPASAWHPYDVRMIAPYRGDIPDSGHLWVVGPDNEIGHWYPHGRFEQVTLIYNQHALPLFYRCMHALTCAGSRNVNVSYISSALASETGILGTITPPAFDRLRFIGENSTVRRRSREGFAVGKATRDIRYKHHAEDPAMYQLLLDHGYRIELVGATCIQDRLPQHPRLDVRGEIPQSEMVDFLLGLDCLVYRTSTRKPEGFGLCILEAMALGVPVIAHRAGGYADIIEQGKNGFLFDSNEQALSCLDLLKNNPDLHKQIRISAIATVAGLSF